MRCIILLSRGFFRWDGGAGKRRGGGAVDSVTVLYVRFMFNR